jgi:hypothetical protein
MQLLFVWSVVVNVGLYHQAWRRQKHTGIYLARKCWKAGHSSRKCLTSSTQHPPARCARKGAPSVEHNRHIQPLISRQACIGLLKPISPNSELVRQPSRSRAKHCSTGRNRQCMLEIGRVVVVCLAEGTTVPPSCCLAAGYQSIWGAMTPLLKLISTLIAGG